MALINTAAAMAMQKVNSITSALYRSTLGSLNGLLGSAAGKLVSQISTATVSLREIKTGQKLTFCWTPERIAVKTLGRFQSYNIIETGDVRLPRGENLQEVSWSAILPGASRNADAFTKSLYWKSPKQAADVLNQWRMNGSKLKLIVTQTGINLDVYIQDITFDYSGGQGDVQYSITLIAAKDMLVRTVDEIDGKAGDEANELEKRDEAPKPETVTVAEGATLWEIAEDKLGDGTKWEEIYNLNRGPFSDPEDISAGIELRLP